MRRPARRSCGRKPTLSGAQACGAVGINGLLHLAQAKSVCRWRRSRVAIPATLQATRHASSVTARLHSMRLDAIQRRELLALARASIESALRLGDLAPCPDERIAPDLTLHGSSFVTLRIEGALRGCCGTVDAQRPLGEDVWRNAWASAFSDPRFPPLSARRVAGAPICRSRCSACPSRCWSVTSRNCSRSCSPSSTE